MPYRKRKLALYRGQCGPDASQGDVLQPGADHSSRDSGLADSWVKSLLTQPPLPGYRGKKPQSEYGWGGGTISDVSTFRSSSSLKCRLLSSIADICEQLGLNFNTILFDVTGSDRSGSLFIGLNHAASNRYISISCSTCFAAPAYTVSIVAHASRHSAFEQIAEEEIESTKCNGNDMQNVMIETHRKLEKMLRDLFVTPVIACTASLPSRDPETLCDDIGVDGVDYAFMCES